MSHVMSRYNHSTNYVWKRFSGRQSAIFCVRRVRFSQHDVLCGGYRVWYKTGITWSVNIAIYFVTIRFNFIMIRPLRYENSRGVGFVFASGILAGTVFNDSLWCRQWRQGWHHGDSGTPTWWRHQIETFSALLALCVGNSPVTGEFPSQRPVTQSFDVFFDLRLE